MPSTNNSGTNRSPSRGANGTHRHLCKKREIQRSSAGEKHTDGLGLYLHVKEAGKYWRMAYRFTGKQKTLALGVYPDVSLLKARQRRDKARELLADGIDPGAAKQEAKQEAKQAQVAALANTFEKVAIDWLTKTAADRSATTTKKIENWMTHDVYPYIGGMAISAIGPRDVLAALRHMEARGALESVQRVKQHIGQVFRYAIATGSAERDPTPDLKGALTKAAPGHYAAITDPKQAGALTRPSGTWAAPSKQSTMGMSARCFGLRRRLIGGIERAGVAP